MVQFNQFLGMPIRFEPHLLALLAASLVSAQCALGPATPFPPIVNSQDPKDIPLSPEEALKKIHVPEGFNVTLFAGDPDVQQPIAMALDPRGRLWVAENYSYDGGNHGFDPERRDRIVVFEDSKNAGHFDKRTVFWDDAHRLTSVEIGFGGVWALCPPNLLFIPDRNGDDVPDSKPVIVLDGWNAGAIRHTIVNGLRWGPDGWLYGRQGIQGTSLVGAPGTPENKRSKIGCGIWRYHPTRKIFEVVAEGTTNPWGFDYDDLGQMFFINTVIGHLWHVIPGAHYKRMYGEDFNPHTYELIDQHADHVHWDTKESWDDIRRGVTPTTSSAGGGHAHTGLMFYLGDNWPDRYRNTLFTINFHGRRFNNDILERSGSGYVGHHGQDFFQSEDPWFRGIDLLYGPDGGVFVTDWSDFGECHDSDGVHRTSGRIYKITYGQPKPPRIPDLSQLKNSDLVKLQLEKNDWYVRQARRLLQERAAEGKEMAQARMELGALFDQQSDVTRQLRAMWAQYVIGGASKSWLIEQLHHPSEHIRTWAIKLLTDGDEPAPDVIDRFVSLGKEDKSGLVRLALSSTLQRISIDRRFDLAAALVSHREDSTDHNLPLMLWYGIEPIAANNPAELIQIAAKSEIPLIRRFIARRLAEEMDTKSSLIGALFEAVLKNPSREFKADIIRGLSDTLRGWAKSRPPQDWHVLTSQLLKEASTELRDQVRQLRLAFGETSAVNECQVIASDERQEANSRRAAVRILLENRVPNLLPWLETLLTNQVTEVVAAQGMIAFDEASIPKRIIDRYARFLPEERPQLIAALVSRPNAAEALLDAITRGEIQRQALSPYHARQIKSFRNETLNQKLSQVWGDIRSTSADKLASIKNYKASLTPERLKNADLPKGRELFNQACAICHTLYGEGAKIGPDLTGSGRGNLDYLLENIVDPSAIVGADFRMSVLTLKDGRVLNGIFGPKTDHTITFQTLTERMTLDRTEIVETRNSTVSLMPEGLLESMQEEQVRDLIGYLMSPRQVPLR